jgi:hypothetical protein
MELKTYQSETLAALRRFLEVARASGPAEAFARTAPEGSPAYRPLAALPDVPYVCLRLPTGGGKTILAAESICAFHGIRPPIPATSDQLFHEHPTGRRYRPGLCPFWWCRRPRAEPLA